MCLEDTARSLLSSCFILISDCDQKTMTDGSSLYPQVFNTTLYQNSIVLCNHNFSVANATGLYYTTPSFKKEARYGVVRVSPGAQGFTDESRAGRLHKTMK